MSAPPPEPPDPTDVGEGPFADPTAAERLKTGLRDRLPDVETFERLLAPVAASPDPDRALRNLADLVATAPDAGRLAADVLALPEGAWCLATVLGSSQSVAGVLVRRPDLVVETLRPGAPPDGGEVRSDLLDRIRGRSEEDAMRLLRRHRQRRLSRIVADDLCRDPALEIVTRRISTLAEDLIEAALVSASRDLGPPVPGFAVLALGKLGGAELNYSSDVDLVFLHAADFDRGTATHLAERLCRLLDAATVDGRCLRVDLRLRPEGSRGAIVRSVESTLDYYRSAGRTWERQALIKARPVAGDLPLGRHLVASLESFVYERALDAASIREIQALKARIEERVRARGGETEEVKEGHGGIRDIEFTVQFLQLLNGHEAPRVRCPGTLRALRRLEEAGALKPGERRRLEETYRFLRVVEHRLQTMHELPARRLPTDETELRRLALRMRPREPRDAEPAPAFRERYERLTDASNAILATLVQSPFREREARGAAVVDAVLDASEDETAREAIAAFGFRDPDRAIRTLRALAREEGLYLPRTRQFFASVAPALLRRVEATVDPDATLLGFERLLGALGAKSLLFQMLDENEDVLAVLVDLCGGSPYLTDLVTANPAMFDPVMESLVVSRRGGMLPFEDLPTPESLPVGPDLPRALHSLRDLEMVRIAIRDLQGRANVRNVMEDLTRLAEEVLRLALGAVSGPLWSRKGEPRRTDGSPGRFAILGLGRLGAGEMIYGSDLDLLFVHDADGPTTEGLPSSIVLTDLAQRFLRALGGHSPYGRLYRVDARLRPGGSGGPLVPSISALTGHLEGPLETWERLALTRARPVAGDPDLGASVLEKIHRALYARAADATEAREVVSMRRRIEETSKGLDLKRGPGGLVDIEFACGWLQLRHGTDLPAARSPSLMAALDALREGGRIEPSSHEDLRSAYQMLRKVESRLRIAYNAPLDRVPEGETDRDLLALRLGYRGGARSPGELLAEELRYFTGLSRRLFEEILEEPPDD